MFDVSWPFDHVEEFGLIHLASEELYNIVHTHHTVVSLESKRAVPLVTQPAVGKETQKL